MSFVSVIEDLVDSQNELDHLAGGQYDDYVSFLVKSRTYKKSVDLGHRGKPRKCKSLALQPIKIQPPSQKILSLLCGRWRCENKDYKDAIIEFDRYERLVNDGQFVGRYAMGDTGILHIWKNGLSDPYVWRIISLTRKALVLRSPNGGWRNYLRHQQS